MRRKKGQKKEKWKRGESGTSGSGEPSKRRKSEKIESEEESAGKSKVASDEDKEEDISINLCDSEDDTGPAMTPDRTQKETDRTSGEGDMTVTIDMTETQDDNPDKDETENSAEQGETENSAEQGETENIAERGGHLPACQFLLRPALQ